MKTLYEHFVEPWDYDRRKHGLASDFVERNVNVLTNMEFLDHLNDAMENYMAERAQAKTVRTKKVKP